MANTTITLSNDDGILVPDLQSVPAVAGDSISFATSDGSSAFLFFSPAAIKILTPAPSVPFHMQGGTAEFTFTSSMPDQYSVYFETSAEAVPPAFPVDKFNQLLLEIDPNGANYGTPDPHTKKGS